jgi:hypothetical protein
MSLFKDIIFMVGLVILVITASVALAGILFDIEEIMTGDAIFGLTWLEVAFILLIIAYFTVILRLWRLYGDFP